MSRYAQAITLKSWNARRAKKAPKRAKPPPRAKVQRREPPRPPPKPRREPLPDVVYDDPPPDDEEDLEGWDADVDQIPDVDDDVGAEAKRRRGVLGKLRDAISARWGKPAKLGQHLQVRARDGFRAAIVEVKPGLYVVAEVPQSAVEFGFGPLLLAPALVKTLAKAFRKNRHAPEAPQIPPSVPVPQLPPTPPPLALPGPTPDEDDDDRTDGRLPRWVDGEVAAEIGCPWKKGERR